MKYLLCFLLPFFVVPVHADSVTFDQDKDFVLVGFDYWLNETDNQAQGTKDDFVRAAADIFQSYQSEGIPFEGFKHSKAGLRSCFRLIELTMLVYKEAALHSVDFEDFYQVIDRQFITLRSAVAYSESYEQLSSRIEEGVADAIQDIRNGGVIDGTAIEFKYIYFFALKWDEIFTDSLDKGTVSSTSDVIALANEAMLETSKTVKPVSERATNVARLIVESKIQILESSARCTTSVERMAEIANPHLVKINESMESGLLAKSISGIRKDVSAVLQTALDQLQSCSRK